MGWNSSTTQKLLLPLALALVSAGATFRQESGAKPKSPPKASVNSRGEEFTLVGAGDIAWCGNLLGAEATAKLIEQIPGTVFAAGDLAYDKGTFEEFRDCYRHEAHAYLVLAGHEHSYERFAPQTPEGKRDEKNGIREIVVGTGGRSHTPLGFATENSEVRNSDTFGVLKLTLTAKAYRWEFIPQPGMSFTDSGEGTCHNHETPK